MIDLLSRLALFPGLPIPALVQAEAPRTVRRRGRTRGFIRFFLAQVFDRSLPSEAKPSAATWAASRRGVNLKPWITISTSWPLLGARRGGTTG